jgi:hypothetical protein
MQNTIAGQNRRLWAAACLSLLLVVFLLSIWLGPKLPAIAQTSKPQTNDPTNPLHLSPADAARRAAIAKLGPIDSQPKSNAADTYQRAMALYNKLTPSEQDWLSHWRDRKLPETAANLSEKLQPILQLLDEARAQGMSNWGDNPLSAKDRDARINMMVGFTQAAQWEAGYQFQSDPAGALQNLADAEALDRSSSGVMYGFANYSALHADTLSLIAQNAQALSTLESAQDPALLYITDPQAIVQTSQNILVSQAAQLQSVLNQYANPATRAQAEQFITDELGSSYYSGSDPGAAVGAIQFIVQTDQQLADNLTDTGAQFQDWYSQVKANAASIPAIDWAPPIIQHQYQTFEDSEILDAMLAGGIAQQQGNPQPVIDPVTGQPFTVTTNISTGPPETVNKSFTSSFNYDGKPVTLIFGPPVGAPTAGAIIAAP